LYIISVNYITNERRSKENGLGGACCTFKEEYKCTEDFKGETGRKCAALQNGV
jgi:hypothetical protein